ncbi:MAG: DUF5960 family protein [Tissierellia bacterium]|nr:DUF5960 family protein [Tissierellia bacterium]
MNRLKSSSVQFDYFSGNYEQFEEDFYACANVSTPLTFLTEDILHMMVTTEKNYFKLNAPNARDGADHYFFFKVQPCEENRGLLRYQYLGHRRKLAPAPGD